MNDTDPRLSAVRAARAEAERLHYPPLDDRIVYEAIAAYCHAQAQGQARGACLSCKNGVHGACEGYPCDCVAGPPSAIRPC